MQHGLKLLTLVCLLGGALFVVLRRPPQSEGSIDIAYRTDWQSSLEEARTSRKPIFLYFGGSW